MTWESAMGRTALILVAAIFTLGMPACTAFKRWSYEGWGRDSWQKPQQVIEALDIAPGASVADLGAGGGYFTFRLADAVGPNGKVYAVDVDASMLDYIRQRAAEEGRRNIVTVLADFNDPKLPDASIDLLFTSDTYHHLEERSQYFARGARVLRPGGRVAIIDLNSSGWLMWLFGHSTEPEDIVAEMRAAGYELQSDHDFLSRQSFLIFAYTPSSHS